MQNYGSRPAWWVRLARRSRYIHGLLPLGAGVTFWGVLRSDAQFTTIGAVAWVLAYVFAAPVAVAETGREDRRMAGAVIAFGSTPWLAMLALAHSAGAALPGLAFLVAVVVGAAALIVARIGVWRVPTLARQALTRLAGLVYVLWVAAYVDVARLVLSAHAPAWADVHSSGVVFLSLIVLLPAAPLSLWAGLQLLFAPDRLPKLMASTP